MKTNKSVLSERRRLNDLCSCQSDEQLLHLRYSYDELTEAAQETLRDELIKRNLWSIHETMEPGNNHPATLKGGNHIDHFEAVSLAVWEGKSLEEGQAVCDLLKLGNIAATTQPLRTGGSRAVQVLVDRDDAEKALAFLSKEIPEEVLKEINSRLKSYDFVAPRCVSCGSTDAAWIRLTKRIIGRAENVECGGRTSTTRTLRAPFREPSPTESDLSQENAPSEGDAHTDQNKKAMRSNRRSVVFVVLVTILCSIAAWYQTWTTLQFVGLGLLVPSEILWIIARFQLGGSFSVRAQARTLITRGLYSRIQNPIYLFGGLSAVGLILLLNRPWYLTIFLALVPIQVVRIKRERKLLESRFGETYLRYKKQTWF
ncbi:MAG: Isoprenylcysteine carboxyl methyltransferase [Edaphobacter sp.]|nr:Isoprenylcysteine carboxyl methyltransferase [Edaphobacter sp.]